MPKTNNFDPQKVLTNHYPTPREIPCYTYKKTLADELSANNLNHEDAKEIF